MAISDASDKNRDVPKAGDAEKSVKTSNNKMGQPEQTITKDGDEKKVLNELDPEEVQLTDNFDITARRQFVGGRRGKYQAAGLGQLGDDSLPDSHNESRGSSMNRKRRINETVQDQSGVSGDFMDKMGGKTDKLGSKQKNTGGAIEKHSESTSGSPEDGCCTQIHDMKLGGKQKNTGGSHEELQDSTSSDAKDGVQDHHKDMAGDLGQNDKQTSKGGQHEPLKGSKNSMSEWSMDNIAGIMEESNVNLQDLFNNYASEAQIVCCEEFQQLAAAYGCSSGIDESVLKALMSNNTGIVFHEGEDQTGRFWTAVPVEGKNPFAKSSDRDDSEPGEDSDPLDETCKDECVDEEGKPWENDDEKDEVMDEEGKPWENDDEKDDEEEIPESRASGRAISEMTSSAGIAAPAMGTAISRGTSLRRVQPPADDDEDEIDEPTIEGFQFCKKCSGVLDEQGCAACALTETHDIGMNSSDPSTDEDGHFTSDATKSGMDGVSGGVKGAMTQKSGSTKPDDGITDEMGGMGSDLGQNEKVKNKGGQEPLKGGGSKMQENIRRLALGAKRSIQEAASNVPRPGKYAVRFAVFCEGIKTKTRERLTEALVDVEELIQAYGYDSVGLEARFFNAEGSLDAKRRLTLPSIGPRGPVIFENSAIFRHAEVANDFADQIASSGAACKVARHNWGASVTGPFNWESAKHAFANIPATIMEGKSPFEQGGNGSPVTEAWGTQVRTGYSEKLGPQDMGDSFSSFGPDSSAPTPANNPEAPGPYDVEGLVCQECGSMEYPVGGNCPECGTVRPDPEEDAFAEVDPEVEMQQRPDEWDRRGGRRKVKPGLGQRSADRQSWR